MTLYDISVLDRNQNDVSLEKYRGKVLLIVNTATQCGLTNQYVELQELYEKFSDSGFEILDFPCNQFGSQAPGTIDEIHSFCTGRFGVTFEQFDKIDVNGTNQSPLYKFLKNKKGGLFTKDIKWNFAKFLVDQNGNVVKRYAPTVVPSKIEEDILSLLDKA